MTDCQRKISSGSVPPRKRNAQKPRSRKGRKGRKSVVPIVRLPKRFPFLVLDRLVSDLEPHLSPWAVAYVRQLVRANDVSGILALGDSWCLRSIGTAEKFSWPERVSRLQVGALCKKFPFDGDTDARRKAALVKFEAAEVACHHYNVVGYKTLEGSRQLRRLQQIVRQVVGDRPNQAKLTQWCRHGPGSSTQTSRKETSSYFKYARWPYHVTRDALVHAKGLILDDERWLRSLQDSYRGVSHTPNSVWYIPPNEFWGAIFKIVPNNRVTTVPKTAKVDRPIAIEPTLNVMLQLGVDGFIRRRLKRFGVDLDYQGTNRVLAKWGTIGRSPDKPATIDLSSASDTVSLRIAKMVLPEWLYNYLCEIRSPKGEFPDSGSEPPFRYRKLSSMGNGATFAIESLLFYAVARLACEEVYGRFTRMSFAIFGDDIVVPEEAARLTVIYLNLCGFEVNEQKSFLSGNVKESCGADWINGRNVRPVYMKSKPRLVTEVYALRNRLAQWAHRQVGHSLPNLDELLRKFVPTDWFNVGPRSDEEFSGWWHTSEPPLCSFDGVPPFHGHCGWGYSFQSWSHTPKRYRGDQFVFRLLMASLRGSQDPSERRFYDPGDELLEPTFAFDVTKRQMVDHRMVTKYNSVWRSTYCSPDTPPVRESDRGCQV